jgi:hypothetical protein
MYYSKATNFGDDWDVVEFTTSSGQLVERWDWLENGPDLATEASVYGNPDGSKFYAVWNQELPTGEVDDHGEAISTNMDSEFRRIFYNLTDTATDPVATLLTPTDVEFRLSIVNEDVLTLVGTGRDTDRLGEGVDIPKVTWFDENGAIYCKVENPLEVAAGAEPIYECEKETELKATEMVPGKYKIKFKVMDNEGNWSLPTEEVRIWVAYDFYDVFLPAIQR